MFLSVIEVIQ